MAETKLNDLPVVSLTDFTGNDRFVLIDDGKARQLTRDTFQTWLLANVQGEQGIQGVAGRDGINGSAGINGLNGVNGLDAYQIAVSGGYIGTKTQWVASLKGATGATGTNGFNGWSPVLVTEARGTDTILKLSDWVGGTVTKPTLLGYISTTGIVANAANASSINGGKGDTGLTGATGATGLTGANGVDGLNGINGLDAYEIAVNTGFIGTRVEWLNSLVGATGTAGINGVDGISAYQVAVNAGFVGTEIQWIDSLKGLKGDTGLTGATGADGLNGADGKTATSIVFNTDLSATVSYTDGTTLTSSTPPIKTGWGTYKDGQYTDVSPFNIAIATSSTLPNTAVSIIENMPTGYVSFYDSVIQKYLLTDPNGFYGVRVKFKVAPSAIASTVNVSMSKSATNISFSEDKVLRGDSVVQDIDFNTTIYGDAILSSNGLTVQVKTYDRDINIYDIEVTVSKLI